MKIKLTHLIDGCVLNLTIAHITMDGERSMQFLRDLGKAYRGHEVAERDFDRSCHWPDRLVEHYPFLGEEVAALPRSCASEQKIVRFPERYDQTIETEILFFSQVGRIASAHQDMQADMAVLFFQGSFGEHEADGQSLYVSGRVRVA